MKAKITIHRTFTCEIDVPNTTDTDLAVALKAGIFDQAIEEARWTHAADDVYELSA
jgi:hypothetical protein